MTTPKTWRGEFEDKFGDWFFEGNDGVAGTKCFYEIESFIENLLDRERESWKSDILSVVSKLKKEGNAVIHLYETGYNKALEDLKRELGI